MRVAGADRRAGQRRRSPRGLADVDLVDVDQLLEGLACGELAGARRGAHLRPADEGRAGRRQGRAAAGAGELLAAGRV